MFRARGFSELLAIDRFLAPSWKLSFQGNLRNLQFIQKTNQRISTGEIPEATGISEERGGSGGVLIAIFRRVAAAEKLERTGGSCLCLHDLCWGAGGSRTGFLGNSGPQHGLVQLISVQTEGSHWHSCTGRWSNPFRTYTSVVGLTRLLAHSGGRVQATSRSRPRRRFTNRLFFAPSSSGAPGRWRL